MASQKKYYFQFVSLDGKTNIVEIWQNTTTTLTEEEVDSMGMPFSIELPNLDHKFQPVWGTGCEINLLSPTNMKFFDGLYHVDKKEFIVKHYIDSAINWIGYLNSEMMRETYSMLENYPVQVTGNDGFALLDRIQFLNTDGKVYSGVKTLFEVICICIDRIELPFSAINIALSTTTEFTIGAYSTLLHLTFIDCANFIQEDGTAKTMREALEAVLAPHGARIVQVNGALWIDDINNRASGADITYYSYVSDGTNWLWNNYITVSPLVTISDVGYMGSDAEIEQSGGKNKQVVKYSPCPIKFILPQTLAALSEFTGTVPASYTTAGQMAYKTLTDHNALTVYSPASFELSYRTGGVNVSPELESDACVCVRYPAGAGGTKILSLTLNPSVYLTKGLTISEVGKLRKTFRGIGIKISGQAQFWRYWSGKDCMVKSVTIKASLKVGLMYFSGRAFWTTTPTLIDITIYKDGTSNMAGEWLDFAGMTSFGLIALFDIDLSGEVYFDFYNDISYTDTNGKVWTNATDHNASIRLRNLALSIVDYSTGKEVGDADVEYSGFLDPLQKDEAKKIDLICGTDITFADKGKIMYLDTVYKALKSWTRGGQTDTIETLLLNSLSSNYRSGYYTLNNMKLSNGINLLNVLQDDYTGDKVFMPNQMTVNYRDNKIDCTLIEISEDQLTITPLS